MFEHGAQPNTWAPELLVSILAVIAFIIALPALAFSDEAECEIGHGTELTVISRASSEGASGEGSADVAEASVERASSEDLPHSAAGVRAGTSSLPKTGDTAMCVLVGAFTAFFTVMGSLVFALRKRMANSSRGGR